MTQSVAERDLGCDELSLETFIAGELTTTVEGRVVRHLDACAACQQRLEQLAGDERWWRDSQVFLSPEPADRLAAPITVAESPDDDEDSGTPPPVSLDFLAPTDDPQSVGRLS